MNIFLIGFMGSGKTHVGQQLAQTLGFDFIDLDDFLEEQEGETMSSIFESKGEAYFRKAEQKYLKLLGKRTQTVIATGGGTPCFFDNMQWINQHGISIYLKPTIEVLVTRLQSEMSHRPILAGQTTNSLYQFIEDKLKNRAAFYEQAQHIISIQAYNQDVVSKLIKIIGQ